MFPLGKSLIAFMLFYMVGNCFAQDHPKLILTRNGVADIRANLGKVPLFDNSLSQAKKEVDAEIELGIFTPVPKDYSGGHTHERHKRNYLTMQKAGFLFQILGDEKYAIYVRDMLMRYAGMYKDLPVHPKERSYARGKLFWQCLNDANWLVYTSQAYDCIHDWLDRNERQKLEESLFRPFADYISVGNPQFFNRIHNHSTWGNVAVGMIALVMDDQELLDRALYGLKGDLVPEGMKDDDGGFIGTQGQKVGFLANLDSPFSPDGYYTEGPYYQRYAMYPFLIFAQALHNTRPDLKIFGYKDGVLLKSVHALLNLSDRDGDFFPINDAQKGMSHRSRELVAGVDIAYHFGEGNPGLLDIAIQQDRVELNDAGLSVALDISKGKARPFEKRSLELRDGTQGDEGGLAILRRDGLELVFKYTAQGLSHGHYDKLSYSLYEDGEEVVQDYGLARFVNIEQKGGGNYLKENTSWAKQTIAHNTLVQDNRSHFNGTYGIGSLHHSEKYLFSAENIDVQVASAKEKNAYPGTEFHRTMALIKDSGYVKPLVLDIVRVVSDSLHQYDLPLYYLGQLMQLNFDYQTDPTIKPLGRENGYQHLYLEGKGNQKGGLARMNWLGDNKFYTYSMISKERDSFLLGRLGANDPDFNLRRDPVMIQRRDAKSTTFVSIVESHGSYSPVSEFAVNAYSKLKALELIKDDKEYTAVKITSRDGTSKLFLLANGDNAPGAKHELLIDNNSYKWTGPFSYTNL